MKHIALIVIFSIVSGLADSQGFIYSSRMWGSNNQILWPYAIKSLLGFIIGILAFQISAKYMHQVGIISAEIQTLIWFSMTIIAIGILSGKFIHWHLVDKIIAILVIIGVGWLLTHVE